MPSPALRHRFVLFSTLHHPGAHDIYSDGGRATALLLSSEPLPVGDPMHLLMLVDTSRDQLQLFTYLRRGAHFAIQSNPCTGWTGMDGAFINWRQRRVFEA